MTALLTYHSRDFSPKHFPKIRAYTKEPPPPRSYRLLLLAAISSLFFHSVIMLLFYPNPPIKVEQTPPKALMVEILALDEISMPSPPASPPASAHPPSPPVHSSSKQATPLGPHKKLLKKPLAASPAAALEPKPLVAPVTPPQPSSPGNSREKEAELLARYTQLLSLHFHKTVSQWISHSPLLLTSPATVQVRLRIRNDGKLLALSLEHGTDSLEDDQRIEECLRALAERGTTWFPPVPENYATDEVLEFLITVKL